MYQARRITPSLVFSVRFQHHTGNKQVVWSHCHTPTPPFAAGQEEVAVPLRLRIVYRQYATATAILVFKRTQYKIVSQIISTTWQLQCTVLTWASHSVSSHRISASIAALLSAGVTTTQQVIPATPRCLTNNKGCSRKNSPKISLPTGQAVSGVYVRGLSILSLLQNVTILDIFMTALLLPAS